jgi:F420-dependent oxidoreductase-like protein
VQVGVVVPQGWLGEYDGWKPVDAWERTVSVAVQAERLGFESVWVFDHFQTVPVPRDEITFESFTTLAALGAQTSRVRLGHVVICAGFRNPALTAKMISTLDIQTGGRIELGIGAGWKEDEWRAYGYGFPTAGERLAALQDHLEILTRMMGPGRATFTGPHASVFGAINVPKPLQQPRVPIMVGGNGPNVTWRLAARYADGLNLDGLTPDEVAEAFPVIVERCHEIGRDPETLSVSAHLRSEQLEAEGAQRVELLEAFAATGVSRITGMIRASARSDEALESFVEDCRQAGVDLASQG